MRYLKVEDILEYEETPNWDFFLQRFTEDEADILMAYTWGVFDPNNTSRQCMYIYDQGFTGKSVFQSALASVLGTDLIGVVQKDSLSNQFGFSKVWDKRLIMVPDNKNKRITVVNLAMVRNTIQKKCSLFAKT